MQVMMRTMRRTLDRMTIMYAQHSYDKMRKGTCCCGDDINLVCTVY